MKRSLAHPTIEHVGYMNIQLLYCYLADRFTGPSLVSPCASDVVRYRLMLHDHVFMLCRHSLETVFSTYVS